jgi:hypothetical protein
LGLESQRRISGIFSAVSSKRWTPISILPRNPMISGQAEKASNSSTRRFIANDSGSTFQSEASDVNIPQKKKICAQGKYLYVSIVNNLKIASPLEEALFV